MPRDALFDLAVNRALSYALSLGVALDDEAALRKGLELWYLKTRFAYRIPLSEITARLRTCPGDIYLWRGGERGLWLPDASPRRHRP